MISFVKTHALGNDFLLVELTAIPETGYASLARRICERHFGIGADGLILWKQGDGRFHLRIFNSDGSEAECSGNGLRCVAAYLIQSGIWKEPEIRLETVSELYTLRQSGDRFEADMGLPRLSPKDIPFVPATPLDRVVGYPLQAGDETFSITACSTGNPHCSIFVDALDDDFIQRVGPLLERRPEFPNATNVEFIHVLNEREIEVAFWERGAGLTLASGTGSCGATVASILNQKTGRSVTVHAPGGILQVEWPENGRLKLTSTANIVAEGWYREA
jgi:diaminopimelate epimerase